MSDMCFFDSPVGLLRIVACGGAVTRISLCSDTQKPDYASDSEIMIVCMKQLDEYFRKERTVFSFPIRPEGTDFQKKIWEELTRIPWLCPECGTDLDRDINAAINIRNEGLRTLFA